ncbi:putative transcriptional regulator [Archaeoglobus sulfaticallidus PM70-1]|uniref:Putative transcriptional regulator n=1 Tax=Archaeoglobus sulfaticallidus PM70-1 TaxID=387631 RepID=N0BIB3_9EURY|nr:transcriptional regulator FilR1 domain-containing protein [Archaeoglobus sulfaticallidus]AGK62017.1 putative transcriptional regulator [Archaeoglobus sulfaticallidus PM70-1]
MSIGFRHLISLSTTPLKLKILEGLENPAGISSLARSLDVSRDTVKPHIRNFVEAGLVERCGEGYRLTALGRIILEKAVEVEKLLSIAKDTGEFFRTHDTSPIPEELMKEIHYLYGGYLVRSSDPFELSEDWIRILKASNWIKGVSPVYHPEFPALFTYLAEERDIKLVLTENVFEKCVSKHPELVQKFIGLGEMRVCSDAKVAFVVAEKGFAMGLYVGDAYDANHIFVCTSDEAVRWGFKLFNNFYSRSRKVVKDHLWVCGTTHGDI